MGQLDPLRAGIPETTGVEWAAVRRLVARHVPACGWGEVLAVLGIPETAGDALESGEGAA